jgi:hypothetical protein
MSFVTRIVLVCVLGFSVAASAAPRHKRRATPHRMHKSQQKATYQEPTDALTPDIKITPPRPTTPTEEAPARSGAAEPEPPPAPAPAPSRVTLGVSPGAASDDEAPPPAELLPSRSQARASSRHHDSALPRERRWGLFGGGLALFLVGYGADIGVTYGLGHQPATMSLIPIAGPLIQMGDSWAMVAPSNTGNPDVDGPANQRIASINQSIQIAAYAVLAVDFAMQVAGTAMAIAGAVGRRAHYEVGTPRKFAIAPAAHGLRVQF